MLQNFFTRVKKMRKLGKKRVLIKNHYNTCLCAYHTIFSDMWILQVYIPGAINQQKQ